MRMVRHMGFAPCSPNGAIVTHVIPVFTGEALSGLRGTFRCVSTPTASGVVSVASAWGYLEHNFYAMWVPFTVAATYASGLGEADSE